MSMGLMVRRSELTEGAKMSMSEQDGFGVETETESMLRRIQYLEDLVQDLENQNFYLGKQIRRYQAMDFHSNNKWFNAVHRAEQIRKSMGGIIKKLQKQLADMSQK